MNEKDQTTAYELVRDYGGTDNAGLLRRKIEAALTTVRQEERAAAFRDAITAARTAFDQQPGDSQSWHGDTMVNAGAMERRVVTALEAAADEAP